MQNSTTATIPSQRMPAALWALTISVFAIGTTEVVTVGLLPTIAADLSISISSAGFMVTLYALGVAIGGPLITAFTGHLPRKKLLLGIMGLFILGNVIAALAPVFWVLSLGRILSGFSHGVFIGIGATIASSLVAQEKRASAISIMFAGLTVAMVTGVPFGTFIGQHYGWRFTFAGVAILGIIGFAANFFLLPDRIEKGPPLRIREQLKVLKNKHLLLGFSLTAFAFAGIFGTFTYLSPLLQQVSGFSPNSVTVLLLVYGAAVALGNMVGGKVANKNPVKALVWMFAALVVVLGLFYLAVPYKVQTVLVLCLLGFFAFSNVPALQFYIVQLAEKHLPGTEDVSSALNIAAFNTGIAMGSYVGGWMVASSLGIASVIWAGALFVVVAFLLSILSWKKERIIIKF